MNPPLQQLLVRDHDGLLAIGRDDLVRYAGAGQIVAAALCLRLFGCAFAELSPAEPPHRNSIQVLTAFPGEGIIDCVEMVTRARTRGRLHINPQAGSAHALPAPIGRFYFEIAIEDRRRAYCLREGFFTPEFVRQIALHQEGLGTPQQLVTYQQSKHALIGHLLGAPAHALFESTEIAAAK